MTFAEHLLLLRRSRGLTQVELASELGLSLRGYQNYEFGLREPKLSMMIALADFYDLSLDELVGRKQEK